ncbi:hypothetical protein SAMD00019534_095110 [Acytostelium subglobosum LB1]|uniref:hypothetical protein n=1 Tax=Acytostelium subglobosum LB1 TaxID=1410327 RepID=UPI00064494CC|nr:hypothetical protein SAMD00019534_095110 [Acytostelium subglobosum LB1]GAM26336.1 hypothetical protein SAMD00019534_095110 [Acytostelium subglobosum LB1]|eukprot:XP_012750890.1 hypothetical protein SAMD00019534_095110 [Acytostelium subglobosum LB1]
MGPVDTSNQSPTINYSGGKYAQQPQQQLNQQQTNNNTLLKDDTQQHSKSVTTSNKTSYTSVLPYANWNSANGFGVDSSSQLDLKQPVQLPNIPSLINPQVHGNNNNYNHSPYHPQQLQQQQQHQQLSISWPQFQTSHELVQFQRSQSWEDIAQQSSLSSAPSSPDSNNIIVNTQQQQQQQPIQQQPQQQQQQLLPHLPQFNYNPVQANHFTPDSSPLLSPTTSYIASSQGYSSQQLSIADDVDRESRRKTSLKVPPSPLDYAQSYHHTLPYPQTTATAESKRLKFEVACPTFAQPQYVSNTERDANVASNTFTPVSPRMSSSTSDVSSSNSAQITPPSTPASHCQHQYQYDSSPVMRPHSPQDNSFVSPQTTTSAPSSPNYHGVQHPISLPLLLTASASLPATPTLSSSQYDIPSSPMCNCQAGLHRNVSRPVETTRVPDQSLECEEFNVPLDHFEDWIDAEGKMVGVSYIKSGGKVIGAHADRKTLNLKAEYERPRNGLRRTKRELLWTQKYVCSRAGFPKRRPDSDDKDSLNRKKVVSKKCGCQSRIVVSVYADDKMLAVVRKIADHSAHMSPQQMGEFQMIANQQRHYCTVHSSGSVSTITTTPLPNQHVQQQSFMLNNYSTDSQQHHQIQQQQQQQHQHMLLSNNNYHNNNMVNTNNTSATKKDYELHHYGLQTPMRFNHH